MLICEQCQSDDIDLVERLPDGRRRVVCLSCQHTWDHGVATAAPKPSGDTFAKAKLRFPGPENVDPARMGVFERLKQEFLETRPAEDLEVGPYWRRYQQIFSHDGLESCDPLDLKDFANTTTGAHPGNMSVFNAAWNEMGPEAASRRTRDTIEYLLYGPEPGDWRTSRWVGVPRRCWSRCAGEQRRVVGVPSRELHHVMAAGEFVA